LIQHRTKRILMLIDSFYPVIGGAEKQAERICRKLIASGREVIVLTRQINKAYPIEEDYNGMHIYRLPNFGFTGASKLKATIPTMHWLMKNKDKYDVIHCHGNNPFEWAAMLAYPFTKKPYLIKLTNPNFLNYAGATNGKKMKAQSGNFITNEIIRPMMLPVLRFTRSRMIRKAGRVLAISPEITGILRDRGMNNISNIPNGIDIDEFHPVKPSEKSRLRKKLKIAQDAVVFVFSGRLTYEKNLLTLVDAWKKLIEADNNNNLELIILGDDNRQNYSVAPQMKKIAKENNIVSISLLGSVDNVKEYLRAADTFILPSYWEGMSNALLESMAVGLPSVVSNIPANRALVDDNNSGFLFDPHSSDELTECLRKIVNDPDARSKMGVEARKIAVKRYSFSKITNRLIGEYDNLINSVNEVTG
jgi:glycosyltransferase involved in cell wall biosynthesis